MNCKNGCDAPRYLARLICKQCLYRENEARRKAKRREDGVRRGEDQFYREYNPMMGAWAKRPLRAEHAAQ